MIGRWCVEESRMVVVVLIIKAVANIYAWMRIMKSDSHTNEKVVLRDVW